MAFGNQLDWSGVMRAWKDGRRVAQAELLSTTPLVHTAPDSLCLTGQPLSKDTHGSKTKRVMYSFGIRGSWWENTFCKPTSHIMIFLLGFWFRELPTTWNSITPLRSSSLAASSRAECAERKLVCATQTRNKIAGLRFHLLWENTLNEQTNKTCSLCPTELLMTAFVMHLCRKGYHQMSQM